MTPDAALWLKQQVKGFIAVRATYETLAGKLKQILKKACDRYAPLARVDARAKSIASFAEKALCKRGKYDNPLERMTDLAGARVVAFTVGEALAVCRFIEQERGFRIDWENSLNMQQRMGVEVFGYDARHYIVELREAQILEVDIPTEIQSIPGGRSYRAEIQVHTMLQNAWSVIGHDRLYKTMVKVPDALKREVHAVAAMLESADKAFARSVELLDHYIRHFQAYRTPAQLQEDIEMWRAIHEEDPRDEAAIYQLGQRLMAAQRWQEAYETLSALKAVPRSEVQRDLGESAWRSRAVSEKQTRDCLRKARELDPQDCRTRCVLANTYRNTDIDQAISEYQEAFVLDPDEPAVLAPFVECHIRRDRSLAKLELMRGTFGASLRQCHERAIRGVYLPQAHFNCARLRLYLGDSYAALNSYAMALSACHLPEMVCDELDALTAIMDALANGQDQDKVLESGQLAGFEWARRLMVVALAAKAAPWQERKEEPGAKAWIDAGEAVRLRLQDLATPAVSEEGAFAPPVVIVAGGCDPGIEAQLIRKYGDLLQKAFEAFSGTIISGGTTAGISGMVGQLQPLPGRSLHRVAYLPNIGPLPNGDEQSAAYEIRLSPGIGYSPAGVLRTWADILRQGIRPGQVRILGINGGTITEFELRLGLALGAVVGVVEDSGRVVKTLLEVRSPCRPEGLVPLPPDAATWAAFIRGASPELDRLTDDQVEPAARSVHKQFRKDNATNPEKHDKSVLPWGPKLPEPYKDSSRHQVRFATLILDAVGYDVVPAGPGKLLSTKDPPLPADYEEKVEAMAELEHGRFCAERLVDGWRYGPEKDLERRINSTIVPWSKLSDGIKKYDFDAVRNFPRWLAAAGLKIVPRAEGRNGDLSPRTD